MFNRLRRRYAIWKKLVAFKDRGKGIDNRRKYWGQKIALQDRKTEYDLVANANNANVYICVRAISDAIKMLPLNVVATETIDGVVREIDDNDHPVNDLLRKPNPNYSLNMLITHIVKSLLGAGNAYVAIEKVRANEKNPIGLELWPKDPRNMRYEMANGEPVNFIQGATASFATDISVRYALNEVIHIRDVDPADNLYGKSRIEAVRDEVALDNYVNQFNSAFFLNGGILNYVLNPTQELTEEQHEEILTALESEVNLDKAFSIFVNRYPGKLDTPDQKHKDIAFLDQLKHNREKIFGQYGLPPFRGGVMEYANYANALAQDLDFWNNTIKPLCLVIEDAIDRQLMWEYFDDEHGVRFDYSVVPALRGDPEIKAKIHQIYYDIGVLTPNEIRGELGLEPLPDEIANKPKGSEEPAEATPGEEKEEKELAYAIYKQFEMQKRAVLSKLDKYCIKGKMMSRLHILDPLDIYSIINANKALRRNILPYHKQYLYNVGTGDRFSETESG